MSVDCTLFVERKGHREACSVQRGAAPPALESTSWTAVSRREVLVARCARRLYPTGALLPEHFVEAEGMLLLEGTWAAEDHSLCWPVMQDYALFDRLAGAGRGRDPADVPLAAPRGIPADVSAAVRPWCDPRRSDHDSRASWLTLGELLPLTADRRFRMFTQEVVHQMRPWWSPGGAVDCVRAVFWFE